MRIFIFFTLFTLAITSACAQTDSGGASNNTYDSSTVFTFCEVMPFLKTKEYNSFEEYLKKNIIYPSDAKASHISGCTYIEFIIEKDGSVSNVKIVNGRELHPSCDAEAIRVISNSPKWNPGMQNGQARRVKKIQKICFNL